MKVFLIRHGIAADVGPDGSDEGRPLTAEGIAELRLVAAGLRRLDVTWDMILSSPLVRARQTAAVLASGVDDNPPIKVVSALSTSGSPTAVTAGLRLHHDVKRVALVGHEPGMGELAARWLGSPTPVSFKKGSVCRIDIEPPFHNASGSLRWFATPKMLRLMARPDRN